MVKQLASSVSHTTIEDQVETSPRADAYDQARFLVKWLDSQYFMGDKSMEKYRAGIV